MKKKQPKKRQAPKPHRRAPRRSSKALMRIRKPAEQSWALTLDEVALVRNHIAKGSTDEELKFCLAVARRRKLDPFKGQIWFVKRRDSTAEGGYRWIPITGIDGLLHLAARDHKDFGTVGKPRYGPMHTVKYQYNGGGQVKTLEAPEWAEVNVWKKGIDQPTEAIVYWDEIYPNIDFAPLVRQMPRLMLGKCAKAQGIRATYPDTGGLYIPEEMQPGPPEFTPSGRAMEVIPPGKTDPDCTYCGKMDAPNGCAEDRCPIRRDPGYLKYTPAQKEVVDRSLRNQATKSLSGQQAASEAGTATASRAAAVPARNRAMTYLWIESDQEALIEGDNEIKVELKQLLGKYVKPPKFEIRVNGDELEALKYELKSRGVGFTRRYPKV
jgi:hypothetical protein